MILVIDNYDSFTYNLVHLVGAGRQVDVYRNDALSVDDVKTMEPEGIVISPGPGRPNAAGISEALIRALGYRFPILGVCLGHQAIAEVYGGRIVHAPTLMHGKTSVIDHDGRTVFANVEQHFVATRYHSLVVEPASLPAELAVSATTDDGVIMGLRHARYPVEGVQFHPESILTAQGHKLMANWLDLVDGYQASAVWGAAEATEKQTNK